MSFHIIFKVVAKQTLTLYQKVLFKILQGEKKEDEDSIVSMLYRTHLHAATFNGALGLSSLHCALCL